MRSSFFPALFLLSLFGLSVANVDRRLVPFKTRRSSSIRPRSWKRELVPKDTVDLEYGLEMATFPSTALKFTAHAETPIVLLEDMEYLLDTITCYPIFESSGGTVVELNFRSYDTYAEALASWSSYHSFVLVTSHLTCNLDDRRGAWLITSITGATNYPQIRLTAQSVPLRQMGASFRISHSASTDSFWGLVFGPMNSFLYLGGVVSSWRQPRALDARFDKVFDLGDVLDLAPRQQLFPVDSSLLQQRSSSAAVLDVSDTSGLQVFCINCVSRANLSVGMELDVGTLGTSISAAHINVTVQQFEHDIQLEISLEGAASAQQSVDVIRTPLPDLGIDIPDIGSIGFFWGASIEASLDVTGGLNFTIGAKTSVPTGTAATFVMVGDTNSSATGWDASTFDLIPFRLNSGSLNATAQLSLSPFLDAEISLLKELSADARLAINTPQLTASAVIHSNVSNQCQPFFITLKWLCSRLRVQMS
ncbi:hypothetical protein B0H11DRAFT_2209907 [Mycena galericulata]|nr:hypothetical protein B0H11DRAFT_2209907 [Mycena galericulata]